jgi:predicted metal-dependent HD superfamily phosphohydrolase
MNWAGQDRWLRLWQAAGATGDGALWYEKLTQAYAEPPRHYHNQQHIAECLAEFDSARHLAQQPTAVELALWFHDAVYEPKASDNEEQSAAMARSFLETARASGLAASVGSLIMATKTHSTEAGPDAALVVDVDLSIFGQGEQRFAEYEKQIREEYRSVPKLIFNFKRAEILESFLARSRIYATDFFAAKYEQQARRNLERSIRRLRGGRYGLIAR